MIALASVTLAAISVNDRVSRRQSRKSGGELDPPGRPGRVVVVVDNVTTESGSGNGSGRSTTARTAPKIAALAPMPRPSVSSVTAAKPGRSHSDRTAYLTSCLACRTSTDWIESFDEIPRRLGELYGPE